LLSREPATIRLHFHAYRSISDAVFGFQFYDETGVAVTGRNSDQQIRVDVARGRGFIDYRIPDLLLNSGNYRITTIISRSSHIFDMRDKAFGLRVRATDPSIGGMFCLPGSWQVGQLGGAARAGDSQDTPARAIEVHNEPAGDDTSGRGTGGGSAAPVRSGPSSGSISPTPSGSQA